MPDGIGKLALVIKEFSKVKPESGVARFDLHGAGEMSLSAAAVAELDEDHGQQLMDGAVKRGLLELMT